MTKSKIPFVRKLIIWACIFLVCAGIFAAWYFKKGFEYPIWTIIWYVVAFLVVACVIWLIVWGLSALFNKDKNVDTDLPKQYVSTDKIPDLWQDAFIKRHLPHVVQHWNDGKIVPVPDDAIRIMNPKSMVDWTKETSDRFFGFEVLIKVGPYRGLNVVITREDYGEDWIKNNTFFRIEQNKSWDTLGTSLNTYPATSSNDEKVRLAVKRLELIEEGYNESELQRTIDPIIIESKNQKPQKNLPPVRSPSITEHYPELINDDDDEPDLDDLKKEIARYRVKA